MQLQFPLLLMLPTLFFLAAEEQLKTARYMRPAESGYRHETEVTLTQSEQGRSVSSVTRRGQTQLSLQSDFDGRGRLQRAKVTIDSGSGRQTAKAEYENGKVKVTRSNGRMDTLVCPSECIVTSAPDWTDAFMLMRRYDEKAGGEQRFDGLWIHPTRQPLRLTFAVTYEATDTVVLNGQRKSLKQFSIVLRNNSRYVAWRNSQRKLVRLVAAGQHRPAIVLSGWEKATNSLLPK